jgi:hypothetical protein
LLLQIAGSEVLGEQEHGGGEALGKLLGEAPKRVAPGKSEASASADDNKQRSEVTRAFSENLGEACSEAARRACSEDLAEAC